MTLLTVFALKHEISVFTDTLSYSLEGEREHHTTKCPVFAHLHAVFASRGPSRIADDYAKLVNGMPWERGFDTLKRETPELLRSLRNDYLEDAEAAGLLPADTPDAPDFEQPSMAYFESILAGWSEKMRRLELYCYTSADDFAANCINLPELILAPPLPDQRDIGRTIKGHGDMVAICRRQADHAAEQSTERGVIGGDLILTQLTPLGILVRRVSRFPERAAERGAQ